MGGVRGAGVVGVVVVLVGVVAVFSGADVRGGELKKKVVDSMSVIVVGIKYSKVRKNGSYSMGGVRGDGIVGVVVVVFGAVVVLVVVGVVAVVSGAAGVRGGEPKNGTHQ